MAIIKVMVAATEVVVVFDATVATVMTVMVVMLVVVMVMVMLAQMFKRPT